MIHIISGIQMGEQVMLAPPIPNTIKKQSIPGELPKLTSAEFAKLSNVPGNSASSEEDVDRQKKSKAYQAKKREGRTKGSSKKSSKI